MDGNQRLTGLQCDQCGEIDFPAQRLGCTRCGAQGEKLIEKELASTGQILAVAALHTPRAGIENGSAVARVRLDDGPVLYGLLPPKVLPLAAIPCAAVVCVNEQNDTITVSPAKE